MVLSTDDEAQLYRKHTDLCNKLNLDTQTNNQAWESFQAISKNFTLEGNPMNWIACAIYVACWQSVTPTVGHNYIQGNGVSFTSLLLNCNLSLGQFFYNIDQWSEMAHLPDQFTKRIEYLKSSVTVACNVFEEFGPLFMKIFKAPEASDAEQGKHRTQKKRAVPCTSMKAFEFCWIIFITIKGQGSSYSNDVVTLCHLLIAVCDWAFKNAFLADRRDLLNPAFEGLPADWSNPSFLVPANAPCIISHLCLPEMFTDAKYIKEYQFKKSIQALFEDNVLTNKEESSCDVFDPSVFESNFRNISNAYETILLNKGDFDEKIFLAEFRRKLIEKEHSQSNGVANQLVANAADSASAQLSKEMVLGLTLTPLTGRKYLSPKELQETTPLVTATVSISRLNTLLSGCQPAPSESLVQLFQSCSQDPTERINELVTKMGSTFIAAYATEQSESTNRRLQMATTLFYKLIETILESERAIQKDVSAIVARDVFYECIFACCLEIVINAYSSRRKFPWVLQTLGVQSYDFVKVIELIIRSNDKFSRETIKHLNMIEELSLSSLIWKSDSKIWEAIALSQGIPKYEETALPGQIQNEQSEGSTLRNILSSENRVPQSPGPSACDRFQSPIAHNATVNRELFPRGTAPSVTHLMIKDRSGNTRMIPIVSNDQKDPPAQPTTPRRPEVSTPTRPRRTGGLSIIFRKFYNLAGERMNHLCTLLKITGTDMKQKIWTVFEEIVRKNNCELIKDRDLDQLLLCAVYIICKLTSNPKRFTDIIKCYRDQPQATSDIYRQVLISKNAPALDGQKMEEEDRQDLITFYNTLVIPAMKTFANKFVSKNDDNSAILLSPLPTARGQCVQVYGNICIKPLESPNMGLGTGKVLNYVFNRSPSKDLNDINRAIRGNGLIGKRLLIDGEVPEAKRLPYRKVQSLMEERRNQNND